MSVKNTKIDPSKVCKTKKHESFVQLMLDPDISQSDAYRTVYPSSLKWKDKTIHEHASRLTSKVRARFEFLRQDMADKLQSDRIMGRKEFEERLTAIMRTSHDDLVEDAGGGSVRLKKGALKNQALHSLDMTTTVTEGTKGKMTSSTKGKIKKESLKGMFEVYAKIKGFNAADKVDVEGYKSLAEALRNVDGTETAMPKDQVKKGGKG